MPSPEEQAYSAVERAYGQGDFTRALELAQALQPQLPPGRPDQLDQRLQLLIGHIHLYGLAQPREAEAAYQAVLTNCSEPNYRQLAEQSLQLCTHTEPTETEAQAEASNASTTAADLPATPWLSQIQDPQQALTELQAAWASAARAAQPIEPEMPEAPATPWAISNGTSLDAAEPTTNPEPEPPADTTPPPPEPPLAPGPQARGDLERGLLLVQLSSRVESGNPSPQEGAAAVVLAAAAQPSTTTATIHVTAPSLGAAWTLFKRHWRSYLILEGLALLAALAGALLQLIGNGLQGLANVNPLLAVLPALGLAVGAIALNLWSNLLGVSLQMLPALAFQSGSHPSAEAMLQLLRSQFWRYVRAGVVVGLATAAGLLLLIVPGVLVAIATPVVIRRVVCQQEAAVPALIASVKEVGSTPAGVGLLQWQLVAGLLIVGSLLLCGLPLLITVPLGGILIQQYLAYSGLGSAQA